MSDEKKNSVLLDNLTVLTTPEGIQKYLLGTKKNGTPRAIYDIVRDYTKPKKKKKDKKAKKHGATSYEFYLNTKKGKKKHKKNKKHWHI